MDVVYGLSDSTSVAPGVIMLKKHWLFPQMNAIDLLFQPLLGLRVSLRADFHTFAHVVLRNGASVVSDNEEHALSAVG
jgi:hypothetical protein